MAKPSEAKVVSATGVSSSANLSGNDGLAERIHDAMQQAIRECLDQGVTDPDEQRGRMLAAREAVLA